MTDKTEIKGKCTELLLAIQNFNNDINNMIKISEQISSWIIMVFLRFKSGGVVVLSMGLCSVISLRVLDYKSNYKFWIQSKWVL